MRTAIGLGNGLGLGNTGGQEINSSSSLYGGEGSAADSWHYSQYQIGSDEEFYGLDDFARGVRDEVEDFLLLREKEVNEQVVKRLNDRTAKVNASSTQSWNAGAALDGPYTSNVHPPFMAAL